ncbi:MAG: glycogen synthase GlgA [Deltaproteobacteria bacterium]|jgi:starch synthase|nr:glycogen synthase GlgA [Deltaproteobacteria bacterium]
MPDKIQVLFASSEVSPLAQTGGLAEVAGSLPQAFVSMGLPTTVVMPAYRSTLKKFQFKEIFTDLAVTIPADLTGLTGGEISYPGSDGTEVLADSPGQIPFSVLEGSINETVKVLLIKCDRFFDRDGLYGDGADAYKDNHVRYAFFCLAIMETLKHLAQKSDQKFDIVVANDWQTGLLMPLLAEKGQAAPAGVFVIHNQGFLGLAPIETKSLIGLPESYYRLEGMEYYGQLSFLKGGIVYSKAVVTVSPTYAEEIQSPEYGNGLDGVLRLHSGKLSGIVNGVDYVNWNPETDRLISNTFSLSNLKGKALCKQALKEQLKLAPSNNPLFSMVSRLTAQKGISLVVDSAPEIFKLGIDLIILGTGETWYEEQLRDLVARYPDNMRFFQAYDNQMAHQIIAGSDFVLVPSMYEPCGLVQLYALRYGAIPIVRAVGGLNDTVRDFAGQNPEGLWDNGFKFSQFQAGALTRAVKRAVMLYKTEDFKTMSRNNMDEDHSWGKSAKEYVKLFKNILGLI